VEHEHGRIQEKIGVGMKIAPHFSTPMSALLIIHVSISLICKICDCQ